MGQISSAEGEEIRSVLQGTDKIAVPEELTLEEEPQVKPEPAPASVPKAQDPRVVISRASLAEKIKMALLGNAVCRGILIRDTNRLLPQFVLRNPRLQAYEIEEFVKNPQISEQVLRLIADNPVWMRAYSIKFHLVTNAKTPGDIALKWLRFLSTSDLKRLARSKNVPQLVAVTAKKRVLEAEKEGGGK